MKCQINIGNHYKVHTPFTDLNGRIVLQEDRIKIVSAAQWHIWYDCEIALRPDIFIISPHDIMNCCFPILVGEEKCESSQPKLQISQAIKDWLSTLPKQG